ncbi:hypothetical protein O181_013236 [Austropuccinia psidii MF-1]|uniref:Uncharacterized protein n=1 Tax=Austropuccinia psidii MF-1 TaxID=1389203 RepID=A0A9Q3BW16_9BASI|nr:hypothetical protein [Austropuccinia psidii MF-1]
MLHLLITRYTPVIPSDTEGNKHNGERCSEGIITTKKWTPISTQRARKPQSSASIQGKPTLITCIEQITIINPVVTSKGKFPKAVNKKSVQGTVKGILESQGPNQRTDKDCSETEEQGLDTLDTIVDGKTLKEIILTLPFTFQFNRNLKPLDYRDMDEVLQLHQLLKDLFQWGMDNKSFDLESHWEELGKSFQKICLKEISFTDLMVIAKGENCNRKFKLLEERATRIREKSCYYPSYRRTIKPYSSYSDSFMLTRSKPTRLPSCFTQFRQQNISDQESPFFTIPGSF